MIEELRVCIRGWVGRTVEANRAHAIIDTIEAVLKECVPCLEQEGFLPEAKRIRSLLKD